MNGRAGEGEGGVRARGERRLFSGSVRLRADRDARVASVDNLEIVCSIKKIGKLVFVSFLCDRSSFVITC